MAFRFSSLASVLLLTGLAGLMPASAQDRSIVVASTTSTQDSGLFGHLLPLFKAKANIDVKVIAQGTGQALDAARRGDADVVFVHDQVAAACRDDGARVDVDPDQLPPSGSVLTQHVEVEPVPAADVDHGR